MKEIVNRLQENRNIERAKQIMESAGYKVSAKPKRVKESKKMNESSNREILYQLNKGGMAAEDIESCISHYQPNAKGIDDLDDDTVDRILGYLHRMYSYRIEKYGDDAEIPHEAFELLGLIKESKKLKEAQINLKGNPELADKLSKTVNTNLKFIHPFGKTDWYGWAGAEKLPSGSDPYIYEEDDYSVIVTGYYDDPSKAWIEVYGMEDLTDNGYSFQSKPGDEAEILALADKISAEIDQGKDLRKIARQYGLTYYKY